MGAQLAENLVMLYTCTRPLPLQPKLALVYMYVERVFNTLTMLTVHGGFSRVLQVPPPQKKS